MGLLSTAQMPNSTQTKGENHVDEIVTDRSANRRSPQIKPPSAHHLDRDRRAGRDKCRHLLHSVILIDAPILAEVRNLKERFE